MWEEGGGYIQTSGRRREKRKGRIEDKETSSWSVIRGCKRKMLGLHQVDDPQAREDEGVWLGCGWDTIRGRRGDWRRRRCAEGRLLGEAIGPRSCSVVRRPLYLLQRVRERFVVCNVWRAFVVVMATGGNEQKCEVPVLQSEELGRNRLREKKMSEREGKK